MAPLFLRRIHGQSKVVLTHFIFCLYKWEKLSIEIASQFCYKRSRIMVGGVEAAAGPNPDRPGPAGYHFTGRNRYEGS